MVMGDLLTSSIFHVIDTKTFYKLLLGWLWLHEYGIVTFTLHQCLKCYRGGERKINDNVKPFTKAKFHFIDAMFFDEDEVPEETMPATIAYMGIGSVKTLFKFQREICPHISSRRKKINKGVHPFQPSKQI